MNQTLSENRAAALKRNHLIENGITVINKPLIQQNKQQTQQKKGNFLNKRIIS
jgi:hypothetical protein